MENKAEISKIPKTTLVSNLKSLVASERKITAEILLYIREVDQRRLYFDYSCTSLFDFLIREIGYSRASAQRRIDSARLLGEIPEMRTDLESGALNLSQVSLLAQCVRQKQKESPAVKINCEEKSEILSLIKNKDFEASQKIIAQELDIEVKIFEKKRIQQDESVRYELTLSKEENETLIKARELCSHRNPGATMNELIVILAEEFIKRKDPASPKREYKKKEISKNLGSEAELKVQKAVSSRVVIPVQIRRFVFNRDQSCQWRANNSHSPCGSKFQLELDHIRPVWDGGDNGVENLQLLCRAHNQLRYKKQTQTAPIRSSLN